MDTATVVASLEMVNAGIGAAVAVDAATAAFAAELHTFALKAQAAGQTTISAADVTTFLNDRYTAAQTAVNSMIAP
jgi:hypothetical protein